MPNSMPLILSPSSRTLQFALNTRRIQHHQIHEHAEHIRIFYQLLKHFRIFPKPRFICPNPLLKTGVFPIIAIQSSDWPHRVSPLLTRLVGSINSFIKENGDKKNNQQNPYDNFKSFVV